MPDGKQQEAGDGGLDPIALTLAVWLGLIVGITGLVRLTEHAADQAAATRAKAVPGLSGSLVPGVAAGPSTVLTALASGA